MTNKIDMFLVSNAKYLPGEKLGYIKEKLEEMDEECFELLYTVEFKDPMTVFLISLFFGYLGIDRFLIGDVAMGVLKLISFGCCGVFTIIDWLTIQNKTKEVNYNNLMVILS